MPARDHAREQAAGELGDAVGIVWLAGRRLVHRAGDGPVFRARSGGDQARAARVRQRAREPRGREGVGGQQQFDVVLAHDGARSGEVHACVGTGGRHGAGQGSLVGDVGAHDGHVARDGREAVDPRARADGRDDLMTARDRQADDGGADEATGAGDEEARGDAHDRLIGSLDE